MTDRRGPEQLDWSYLAPLDGGEHDRRLSTRTLSMALSALSGLFFNRYWTFGGKYLTPEQQTAKNDAVHAAVYELLEELQTGQSGATCGLSGGVCGVCGEELEGENMAQIVKFGGRPYLLNNCGCGDSELYPLSMPATLNIGAGGAVQIPSAEEIENPFEYAVADEQLSCFAAKAVPYLLARAYEYFETANGVLSYGVDVVAGGIDELLDLGTLVADLLGTDETGTVDTLRNFDTTDVYAAYTDAAYVARMTERWETLGYTDAPNKSDLRAWALSSPATFNGVPVRGLLEAWLDTSILLGYGGALQTFAAECNSGQTLDGLNDEQSEWLGYEDITVNSVEYRVWSYALDHTFTASSQSWEVPSADIAGYTPKAMGMEITMGAGGNMMIYLNLTGKYRLFEAIPAGQQYRATYVNADALTAIEQVSEQTFVTQVAQDGSTGLIGVVSHSISQPSLLDRVWFAGIAAP